jgi:phosphoribosyl 1,2-cyclic phosphodiesterase
MKQKTKVCVLASTSSGNCTVVWNDKVSFLVDFGTNITYTQEKLAGLGLSLENLTAAFITHCHSDHVNKYTLKRLVDRKVPIYCDAKVAHALKKLHPLLLKNSNALVSIQKASGRCNGFSFTAFDVPHDSTGGCFGYSFFLDHSSGTHKVSIATDIGFTKPDHVAHFADSDIIIIESNHDVTMLAASARPQWLKDRIVKTGHLSNEQSSGFVREVVCASKEIPAAIVLAHISQECNTNGKALSCMRDMLALVNKACIEVVETHKEKPSRVVCV